MQLLTVIGQTYNYFKFPKDDQAENEFMISTWHNLLGHLDRDLLFTALKEHILYEIEVPTPAHLVQKVKQMTRYQMSGQEAYTLLMSSVSRYGIYRKKECMEQLPEPIQNTVRIMGGLEVFANANENDPFLKNNFIKNYEQRIEVEEKERLLPEAVRQKKRELLEKIRGNSNGTKLLQ